MPVLAAELILGGRFRLERPAGAGGHGEVWRAHDLDRGVPVAVKVLAPSDDRAADQDAARRLAAEAAILAALDHPGIVAFVAHGVTPDGAPYLVEDWIEGPTLRDYLAAPGLTVAAALDLCERVATIVGAAHAAGIVHRDLKPDNVLLADGRLDAPRLIDFGVSRRVGPAGLTRSGTVLGSIGYLAPEQVRAERDLDARTDVFALGCLLYEALTGRPAFAGSGLLAVSAKVQFGEPAALATLCPEAAPLAPLVARALAKARDRRPADARALAALLAAAPRPAGPTRRAARDPVTTAPLARDARASTAVLALGPSQPAPADQATWTALVGAWPGPGQLLAVEPGTVVVQLAPPGVDDAVAVARRLRDTLPDTSVVVVTTGADDDLDAGFALAERASLADAFAGAGARLPIRVDPTTARALPARVAWVRGAWQLVED